MKWFLAVMLLAGCTAGKKVFIDAASQYKAMGKRLAADQFPKTYYEKTDQFQMAPSSDWCSGFYPGTLFYLYQQTKDPALLAEAERMLSVLKKEQHNTSMHDLGFMMYCSFGNAQRIAPKPAYKDILLTSARSLATRFNTNVGCIRSWNSVRSLDGKTQLMYPVIIDNLMNLELLFYASAVSGDTSFRHIAVTHARTTMANHVRPDYSSYHVVNYDEQTGAVTARETHQGFSDNSTWARGQAWGIYGFTMVYRESHDTAFLRVACGMADYFLKHLPADKVPYWDFNVGEPGFEPKWKYDASRFSTVPRDASAAAVAASALIELAKHTGSKRYRDAAGAILKALSSAQYRAGVGTNGNFLLRHSTGNAPRYAEIDVPLTYADYYYVEALTRLKGGR